jgi:hypothetical protein
MEELLRERDPCPTKAAAFQASRRDLAIAVAVAVGGVAGLWLDSASTLWQQYGLGLIAWVLLCVFLHDEGSHVRIQVAVVIAVATLVEHLCAPGSHVYIYRFDNVPAYVPPAHGMVYLSAAALGRSAFFHHLKMPILWATLLGGSAWALYGAWLAERVDHGGAILFTLFLVFLLRGQNPLLYAAAFFMTTFLELVGTHYGTWAWSVYMPDFDLPQANPPSGIAAGYCLFDAAAVNGAAFLEAHRQQRWFQLLGGLLGGLMALVLWPVLNGYRQLQRSWRP